jgi:hypothetical protein
MPVKPHQVPNKPQNKQVLFCISPSRDGSLKRLKAPSAICSSPSSPTAIFISELEAQKNYRTPFAIRDTAAGVDMEVDYPVQPASLPSAYAADDAVSNAKLDGVFTMDEFLSNHGPEHATMKAARTASAAMKMPLGLVPVGARSSKHTIALHMKYQALRIPQPSFTFDDSQGEGWTVEVNFPGLENEELQGIKNSERYASKHEAKEGLSERALEILTRLEGEGKVKQAESAEARYSKYTALVNEKVQQLGIRQPSVEYSGDSQSGWTAEGSFPGFEIEELHGLEGECRQNKKEAKESLFERVWEIIKSAESAGRIKGSTGVKGQAQQPQVKEEPSPNYVGQLLGTYSVQKCLLLTNKASKHPQQHIACYFDGIKLAQISGMPTLLTYHQNFSA